MIVVKRDVSAPAYLQICEGFRRDIESGSFSVGERLPSVRELAKELGVSINTVDRAYQQLMSEGLVISRNRAGYYVDPSALSHLSTAPDGSPIASRLLVAASRKTFDYDYFYGSLPFESFPAESFRKIIDNLLYSRHAMNEYSDPFGDTELRRELCKHLVRTRGIECRPEQVVVMSGTRDALDRLSKLFDPSHDTVAVEQPGWPGVVQVFGNNRFNLCGIRSVSADALVSDLEQSGAKLAYLTPAHQFPLGTTMDHATRQRVLEWARGNDAYIIEDDYDSEYCYDHALVPALGAIDRRGRVIYSGTFSKVLAPGLRTSYLVLPDTLLAAYKDMLHSFWSPVPWVIQRAICEFMRSGAFDRCVRQNVKHFKDVQRALVDALRRAFPNALEIGGEGAGLHLWIRLLNGEDASELQKRAAEYSVGVYTTSRYWLNPADAERSALLMGYSGMDAEKAVAGVDRLKLAWEDLLG